MIYAFDMVETNPGTWTWSEDKLLQDRYFELATAYNKYMKKYIALIAHRNIGGRWPRATPRHGKSA